MQPHCFYFLEFCQTTVVAGFFLSCCVIETLIMSILLRLKGDLAYNYKGPRTKDDIIEFANRVAG